MKKSINALIFISISLFVLNCASDEKMPVQGKVQFAVAVSSKPSDGGRVASNGLPDSAYVSLSIETTSGVSIYSLKRIDLIKLGEGYITAPIVLTEGNYRLTDFMILSKNNEVLYATPKEGSTLASLVDDPLPVNFSVTKDGILNLDVQVVSATQQSPEDFGYVSFGVRLVEGDFSVSLFTMENSNMNFTSGTLSLYQGNNVVYTQNLLARINPVNFKGDPNATYTLLVEKEGYTLKSKTYVLHSLLEELNGNPLTFVLSPASTLRLLVKEPSQFGIQLWTTHEDIFIDWGDGTVEQAMLTSGDFTEVVHNYVTAGRFFINITGGLNFVTEYWFTFVDYNIFIIQDIESVDITQLKELQFFFLEFMTTPKAINFSQNTKLKSLIVDFCNLEELDISNNPLLNYIRVGTTQLIPHDDPNYYSKIDNILTILTAHIIANNIREGTFAFSSSWEGPKPDELLAKIAYLQENYGWHFY